MAVVQTFDTVSFAVRNFVCGACAGRAGGTQVALTARFTGGEAGGFEFVAAAAGGYIGGIARGASFDVAFAARFAADRAFGFKVVAFIAGGDRRIVAGGAFFDGFAGIASSVASRFAGWRCRFVGAAFRFISAVDLRACFQRAFAAVARLVGAAIAVRRAAVRCCDALMVHRRRAVAAIQIDAFVVDALFVVVALSVARAAIRNVRAFMVFGFLASAARHGFASVFDAFFRIVAFAVQAAVAVDRRAADAFVKTGFCCAFARLTAAFVAHFGARFAHAFAARKLVAVFANRAAVSAAAVFAMVAASFAFAAVRVVACFASRASVAFARFGASRAMIRAGNAFRGCRESASGDAVAFAVGDGARRAARRIVFVAIHANRIGLSGVDAFLRRGAIAVVRACRRYAIAVAVRHFAFGAVASRVFFTENANRVDRSRVLAG